MLAIADAIAAVATLADDAVKRIWPDATEVEKTKLEQLKQELQNQFALLAGQIDINKIEAANPSVFVSGWRPFVGWACGVGVAYVSVIEPIARFVAAVGFGYVGAFPLIDTEITLQVLLGLLGLAGMRTFEKVKKG